MTERAARSRGMEGRGRNTIAAVFIMAALVLVAFSGLLSGQTLTVTNVTGTWEDTALEGGGPAAGEGSSYIHWGEGSTDSGYRFNARSGSFTVPQDTPVLVGEFVHENWPITGDTLVSANLEVTLQLEGLPDLVIVIPMAHVETPNRPETYPCSSCGGEQCVNTTACQFSTPANDVCDGCADRVSISSSSIDADIGSIQCTVTATFDAEDVFYTAENANNAIDLYIELTCEVAEIVVEKQTDPSGDPTTFSFSGDLGSFSLNGDGDSKSFAVSPDTYTITEDALAGWVLTGIDGDNNGDPSDGVTVTVADGDSKTVTFNNMWIDVRLSLTPETDTNQVGNDHVFTATLEYTTNGTTWLPLEGETIDFAVTSGPGTPSSGSDATDANGEATFTVNSDTTGTTAVEASFDGTVVGASATADDTADKDWIDVRLSLTPETDTNQVGNDHVFTATLEYTTNGTTWLPLEGETIDFAVTSGPGTPSSGSDATDANGEATFTVNSDTTGTTAVEASFDGTVVGASATADDTADKDWIDVRLSLDPPFDTNEVGDPHTFTATLEYTTNGTTWLPLEGETIDFAVTSGPGNLSSSSDTTDSNGEASVTLNSSATGTTAVEASFDGIVVGAAATADDTAEKLWVKTDITIDKTVTDVDGDGPAGTVDEAGDVISYRIVVGNAGTRDLTGVSVSDPLLGALTGPSGDAGGDGVLGVGESWTYTGSYTVLQSDIDGNGIDSNGAADNDGDIDNTATVSSNELPDESDSEAVQISVGPNYTIDKTVTDVGGDGPAGTVDEAGDVISYRIVVENTGNVSLTGVSVSDPLLNPLAGPSGDDGDGVLDVGESWTYTGSYTALQSDIDDNGGGDGDIDNTATVSSNELPDESDSEDVPLLRNPSIGIVKTGDAGPVNVGQTIQYSITVTNTGNVTLHNVTLSDAKLGLSQNLGTLDPGDSAAVTPTYATSEADLPGPVVNTAIADSDETGPASDSHSVDLLGGPALAIVKTGPSEVLVGETIAYTITVTNVGDVTLHDVAVSDAKLGLVDVPVGDLAPGASATVMPAPKYGPTTEADVPRVDNTATADSDETDPVSDDHSVVVRRPLADLIVEKIVDDPFTTEGATVAFTVTVTNGGPDTATGVALQDVLPLGLLYVSDSGGGDYSEVTDRWTVGTLPVGSSASLRISALVDEGTLGTTITNTARVIETDIEDPDESNNEDSADVTVIAADLAVVKTVDNPTPAEGDTIVWTITVLNNGPDDATGIVISDVLPDGLIYVDDDGAGSYNEASGDWTIALLPIAGARTLHITAETEAGTAGQTIVNVASIEESDLPDPNPANDEDDDEITVIEGVAGGGGAVECEEKVIISEIAWAGTAAGPEDEWIELRNIGNEPIDLSGWVLRWRKKEPVSPEDFRWKVVPLSGVLAPAAQSACELAENDPTPSIEFIKRDDGLSWRVVARPVDLDESYLLLERGSDFTVLNLDADIVYDDVEPYEMELSNEGDVIELLDADGQVVDTANAFDSFGGGWPAGDARTFATMERTDPLGPDEPENWHTNLGIVTRGVDANGRPLVATSDVINSQTLEEMELFADLRPTITMAGTLLEVGLDLPRSERAQTGWPWIRVTQPTTVGSPGVAGAGGGVSPVFSFTSRYEGDLYLLGIETAGLPAGDYLVWAVYGEGETVLVPITVR